MGEGEEFGILGKTRVFGCGIKCVWKFGAPYHPKIEDLQMNQYLSDITLLESVYSLTATGYDLEDCRHGISRVRGEVASLTLCISTSVKIEGYFGVRILIGPRFAQKS